MKQFENIFRTFLLAILCFFHANGVLAQSDEQDTRDSVEIGIITCSPHEEIYSLYGHTAIRYKNYTNGDDLIFNYGIFNFKKPHFALRFIFGKTDYELGVAPTMPFLSYYAKWGSSVTEQVLNLTEEEKARIFRALSINYRDENRTYRYNYFYDNCSTRPRDIVERNIDGEIIYHPREDYHPTYREMIREKTSRHPWAAFGNDVLLGIGADKETNMREQQFLPDNLLFSLSSASITRNGKEEPLVKETRVLVAPGVQVVESGFPLTPTHCALILLAIIILVSIYEYRAGMTLNKFDALLMLLSGTAGIILFLMIFSEHPTTSINPQILVLNPLALFFIYHVWRGKGEFWFKLNCVLLVFFLCVCGFSKCAEGMGILALCLLIRTIKHIKIKSFHVR